jgi:acetyl-CoA C-acetyltransferase
VGRRERQALTPLLPGWERWRHLDPRTPVVAGVARAGQDVDDPGGGDSALGLMVTAALAAGADAGAPALLERVDRVAVPEGTWTYRNAAGLVARAVGAPGARTVVMAVGIPQQTLLDDAVRDLRAGDIDVALVVGGEAAHRAVVARRAGVDPDDGVDGDDGAPDEHRRPEGEIVSPPEIAAKVYSPPEQYALLDSALRAAEGQTIDEHRDEIAALWARFGAVAGRPMAASHLREPGPGNRAIAFPYNRWHCSQLHVDQSAALVVCTLAAAEAAGADPAKIVFPLVALESSHALAVPRRRHLHRWPAMEQLGAAAAAHLGRPLRSIEHAEVYSCFPAAVRVQQRALGLPVDGTPTITGGMPFAGGPWNNFVLQATVAMVERLRADPGTLGLVTTVSGFLTKPGLAVYGTEPPDRPLLVADLADRAAAATDEVPLAAGYTGPATVAAWTVSYDRDGGTRTIVVADTPAGERCVATSEDADVAAAAVADDLSGATVAVDGSAFTLQSAADRSS